MPKLDLQPLTDAVTNEETVEASAVALINGFADAVAAANQVNQAAVDDVVSRMRASADSLAAAVTANTPAAPTV